MIIHKDNLIELSFDPKSDILSLKWPNLIDIPSTVVEQTFNHLADTIKHYNITKLLLDSKGTVTNLPDEEYKPLTFKLFQEFIKSNLRKIARVVSDDLDRERRAQEFQSETMIKYNYGFQSKEFPDKESALAWLEKE